ncbi:Sugar transporter [Granulibacter bethesdensis]|uniref:sugar porter family MFS transporter n=1 Tax=Granulibacter bethesdensis TaxID=364410 RepID=UPI00090AC6D0|nr:sugar porter family MFS transporter [Granulibacter bethesdensis]APH56917.1 Sugar transporter [Granulibacter bethesdensis]
MSSPPIHVTSFSHDTNENLGRITETRQSRRALALITVVSTLGGLLFGYDTGVINGALTYIGRDLALTPATEGMVTGALLLGAALGAAVSGRMCDAMGRRKTILLLSLVFFVGALACSMAPTIHALIGFRAVLGLAVGGASVAVPTYLSELAPAYRRGRLITCNELMIVSGQLLAFAINAFIGNIWGEQASIWRWMLSVATLPAFALGVGMLVMPESPRWLVSKGRSQDAAVILEQIRNPDIVQDELNEIDRVQRMEQAETTRGWAHLAEPWIRQIFLIALGIGVIQQVTGVNAIMYYGTQILSESGFGEKGALIANVLNGAVSVFATFIGIYLLGRLGRPRMLTLGLVGTTTSLLLIGLCSLWFSPSHLLAALMLFGMSLFLAFQQGFVSPVTWVLLAEIFPLRIRGMGMGAAVLILWLANFLVALAFPPLIATIGVPMTFLIFVGCGICSILFTRLYIPETAGRSLEDIEELFHSAR